MKKKQTFCSAIVLSAGVAMAASMGAIAPEMGNTEGQTSEISTAFKKKVKAVSDHSNEAKEVTPTEESVPSPIEGVINNQFVDEATMKGDLMNMLAKFSKYLKNDFQDCVAPNSVNEVCGAFKCNSTMQNNEDGVRSNADLSMISAFLVKYGKDKVTLPEGVTWDDLEKMAMKSLVFAYSTHKANK